MADALGAKEANADAETRDQMAIVLHVEDLEATVSDIRGKGAKVVGEPRDYPAWTIRAAHVRDPDGNLIELFAPLPEDKWTEDVRKQDQRYKTEER